MRTVLALVCLAATSVAAMPMRTLFTARASADEVVPPAARSDASATGAFTISADARSVAYRLTWDGLRSEKISTIDVHDFGRGKVGASVFQLCGGRLGDCPQQRGGTVEGTWPIPQQLTRELGVERLYVDIHTSAATGGEIRGQILPLPWMVHSEQFVAAMRRKAGDVPGNGTATLYITPFPQGTQLQFDVTVAGLPNDEALVVIQRAGRRIATLGENGSSIRRRGATISAVIKGPSADLISAIRSGRAVIAVVSKTTVVSSGPLVPVM
jgi:hypothetical protein